jgi:hypothetical protein
LFLPYTTVGILFVLLLGFYFLMQTLRLNQWLSIGGAIGFAFATFTILIISVGHITQAYAIAYMPPVIASFIILFDKKYLLGTILAILTIGLEISCSHPQIAYYTFLIVLALFLFKTFEYIKSKELKHLLIVGGLSGISVLLALAPNIVNLATTYEYSKYSTRGKSELTQKNVDKESSGLERDYAYTYSYGVAETFSILVPNFMGAGVNGYKENSRVAEELQRVGVQDAARAAASFPVYWGTQSFRAAPSYFGAIICFLFVFGLFLVRKTEKWWLLVVAALAIVLSWGKNFTMVSDLFFYYFPGYSKFRTVEMTLTIAYFAFPLLGFIALKSLCEKEISVKDSIKALKYAGGIVGGLLLVFILIPGWFFDFTSSADNYLISQLKSSKWPEDLINSMIAAMQEDRASLLRADAFRSLIFIALTGGLIWVFVTDKLKVLHFSIALTLLILIDMWSVGKRYVNNDNFVSKSDYQNQISITPADEFILRDTTQDYRVLNLARNTFNDATTSYYHKSIGGYHGAKMKRYQEFIEGPINADLNTIQQLFSSKPTQQTIEAGLKQLHTLNMLNTKYIIYNLESTPIQNTAAYGNVWFVKNIKWVKNADEEYESTGDFDPLSTAIINEKWKQNLPNYESIGYDSLARISLVSYKPNHLVYSSKSASTQLAVMSEIFYNKGWNAYIDGQPVPHAQANYVLRTLIIPAGDHEIEFKFEPSVYNISSKIALAGSILVGLLLLGYVAKLVIDNKKKLAV